MNKRIISIISIIAMLIPLCSCSTTSKNSAKIFVATDTHYLSSSINDKGDAFWQMMDNSDGKITQYCDEIFDAFSSEVIESQPDVLILSGDLSFNGEKASHLDFVNKLKHIQDNGVQVLTIPGNHDIDSKNAFEYKGDQFVPTGTVNVEEYKELYYEYGMKQAESIDDYSLSYTYKVNDKLYVLMLDTNAYGQNFVQDSSYQWIEEQLMKAQKEKAQIITVSHQNLFAHNEQLSFGYQLYDAKELLALYNKYEVACNLSGHIHLQHYIQDGITEVVTSSLQVAPVSYGIIDYNGNINYHTKEIDVAAFAKANSSTNKELLDFGTFSKDFFIESGKKKSADLISKLPITDEEKELVADTFAKLNAAYFAGEKCDINDIQQGIDIINSQEGFMSKYIQLMLDEAENEYTSCKIKKR